MNTNKVVTFQSRWLERCIRDYLGLGAEEPITESALSVITYLYVTTTHGYEIAFGKGDLPKGFYFEDAGDEWECCCVSNPGKYGTLEAFVKVMDWENDRKILSLKKETVKAIEEESDLREPGEVRLWTMQGTERLLELEELCIWPEFYYCD